ncbi:MAG: GGDEF domain-containing protein [Lachnospiraceae bacterium]|nr:GGDEF domain-containing protein [Lachnospiraceae bacterium]
MKRQTLMLRRMAVLLIAFVTTLAVILIHRHIMVMKFEQQLIHSMDDVSAQNKSVIEAEVEEMQEILAGIVAEAEEKYPEMNSDDELKEVVAFLKPFAEIYRFKRMGVITLDGVAHCTDGHFEDIQGHEVSLLGNAGIANITGSIQDTIGEKESINVLSMPVHNKNGEVMGILFATARTSDFRKLINVESFEGLGYSYIIQKDGTVVTDSEQSPMYGTTNLFESMLKHSEKNVEVVEEVQKAINDMCTGHVFAEADGKRYLHYAPLDIDDVQQTWYLCTIVTSQILDERMDDVLDLYDKLLILAGLIIMCTVLYYIGTCGKDEKTLRTLAYVDPITQGDNYACFLEKFKSQKEENGFFVSFDINEFKLVNSICGINKGNETLKEVWNVIASHLTERELAAHINGDHYVLFLKAESRTVLIERISKISDDIKKISSKISIISIWPYFGVYESKNQEDPETCYGYANQAKHLVRGKRKTNYAFYESINYDKVVEEKQLVDLFDEAIEKREFEVWYQPKYKSDDETVVGAEALVRWRKEDGTLRQPLSFIPLFEKNGLIANLDEYVFRMVCIQQKKWMEEEKHIFPISVNISRASLYYDDIVQRYQAILEDSGLKPEMVPLEITESATVDNSQIKRLVERFHSVGFPIHLDDFGNGYSALSTLNMMRFDTLKLDKGLVDFIGDSNGEKLLGYTIKLAKSLGMRITAEGVEYKNQVDFLQNLQCDEIQGYYFSKPLPLQEFEQLIK